jgi:hypothetical protein
MSDQKYINGVFIQKKAGQYGEYLSIGLTDEAIEQIKSIKKNNAEIRNFIAVPRKGDSSKFSVLFPKERDTNTAPTAPIKSDDDLPF